MLKSNVKALKDNEEAFKGQLGEILKGNEEALKGDEEVLKCHMCNRMITKAKYNIQLMLFQTIQCPIPGVFEGGVRILNCWGIIAISACEYCL